MDPLKQGKNYAPPSSAPPAPPPPPPQATKDKNYALPPSAPPAPPSSQPATQPPPPPVTGIPVTGIHVNPVPTNPAAFQVQTYLTIQNSLPRSTSLVQQVGWTTGLFDCDEDIVNCCVTLWCPCITFGQIAEIVDRGATPCVVGGALYFLIAAATGFHCFYSCFYRTKLRAQYGLPEHPLPDIVAHCCCEACALCQAYRELQNRGYDMTTGWNGNTIQRQNRVIVQAPQIQGSMMR